MGAERRASERVKFGQGYGARILALDGKWHRPCTVIDVSNIGAKLRIDAPLDGLTLTRFFLVLTRVGQAHRRCELVWRDGNQMGVRFIKPATHHPRAEPDVTTTAR